MTATKTRVRGGCREVSVPGLGCMGLSVDYGQPVDEHDGIALILAVADQGVTFFDTAETYGPFTSENSSAMAPSACGSAGCAAEWSSRSSTHSFAGFLAV
jgi:hypothetical protein